MKPEYQNDPGAILLAYTAAGDIKLDLRKQHTGTFGLPLPPLSRADHRP